tara:strand:- start:2630 stop:3343 length:714 start_codon:yes stop_codon:yes gene_type:complete
MVNSKRKKVIAVVLARLGSRRLKRKMLKKIDGISVIDLFLIRLKKCKKIDKIILATSNLNQDKIFNLIAKKHKIKFFRGSEKDVLGRLNKATALYKPEDIIVRANADNPIFMPNIVDDDIKNFINLNYDVFSPFFKNKLPFGYSFVLFKKSCLLKLNKIAKKKLYREHVENYCLDYRKKFKVLLSKIEKGAKLYCPSLRVTLDTENDLKNIKKYYNIIKNVPIKYQAEYLINSVKKK